MFDPETNRFPYPMETDRHYLTVHKNRGIVFDEKYPYVDKSKGFRFRQGLVRLLLHVYAEGSMWEYYAPVRPFKRGAAHIAVDTDKPILPLGFSYREPGWIRKKIFHQIAKFTVTIGEPLFPDASLPEKERERDLTVRCRDAVCRLVGIDPQENLYPPVFDDSKRIDYYTDTYGVGYKGSH